VGHRVKPQVGRGVPEGRERTRAPGAGAVEVGVSREGPKSGRVTHRRGKKEGAETNVSKRQPRALNRSMLCWRNLYSF